jgi:hypothetical protein
MNNYLKDSGIFFKEVSKRIQNDITDNEVIQLSFNLALGCERLLKGILYDINPTYILTEPDFKHSIQTIYPSRLIPEAANSKELASRPNSDVISFSNSLLKAQLISKSIHNHKNVLFVISNSRDIIAHCELNLLDKVKMKEILQRDFYTMIKAISSELNIRQSHFFDQSHIKLSRISRSLQTDLDKQLELLLEEHEGLWKLMSRNPGFTEEKIYITELIFKTENKEKIDCPACHNDAIVYLKPVMELDLQKMIEVIIGYQVKKLKCQYCKLEITDPSMLDKLGINDRKIHSNKDCIYCGQEIENGETCQFCNVHQNN